MADLWRCAEHSAIDLHIVGLTGSETAVVGGGGFEQQS